VSDAEKNSALPEFVLTRFRFSESASWFRGENNYPSLLPFGPARPFAHFDQSSKSNEIGVTRT